MILKFIIKSQGTEKTCPDFTDCFMCFQIGPYCLSLPISYDSPLFHHSFPKCFKGLEKGNTYWILRQEVGKELSADHVRFKAKALRLRSPKEDAKMAVLN